MGGASLILQGQRFPTLLAGSLLVALPIGPGATGALEGAGGGFAADADLLAGRIVVRFSDVVPADVATMVPPGARMVLRGDRLGFVSIETDPALVPHLIQTARAHPGVADAYPARAAELLFTPNDPRYVDQWGPAAVGLPEAWESGLGHHSVKIAILDTGADYSHPDLRPNLAVEDPSCGPDLNLLPTDDVRGGLGVIGRPDDDEGHGTHVAGIAAAATANGLGVAGAAQVCVMVIKVGMPNPNGGHAGIASLEAAALGVRYAADNGADVISMSFGSHLPEPLLGLAVEDAWARGVLIVAAAGNSECGTNLIEQVQPGDSTHYPAKYEEVIAVSNLATPDRISSSSSCGPAVELAAPGTNVLSTTRGGGYGTKSGTSMAAPLVAGIAALLKSQHPELTNAGVRCLL